MALFKFECEHCKHIFENIQKYEEPPPFCPRCQKETKKLMSQSSFILKPGGAGWANTRYS